MSLPSIVWLCLVVLFVIVEAVTTALISIWFVIGAIAALIVSLITPSWVAQLVVFTLVSALALALTKPLVTRMRARRAVPTNADLNIGRTGCVIAAIAPGRPGRVRLDGVDWSAVCDAPLSEGQACTVLALEGATLTVAPLTAPQAAVR